MISYDFVGVLQWFAERVDRIILLFDANKLDISDEFRRSIEAIHGYEDKVSKWKWNTLKYSLCFEIFLPYDLHQDLQFLNFLSHFISMK